MNKIPGLTNMTLLQNISQSSRKEHKRAALDEAAPFG